MICNLQAEKNCALQLKPNNYLYHELKEAQVIVWDEAPMTHRYYFEAFDVGCRDIMQNDRVFGGKVVVLGGDFRQCCPIKKGATPSQILDITLKRSHLWRNFTTLHLTINMRALPEEVEFKDWALKLGDGTLQSETPGSIDIPLNVCRMKELWKQSSVKHRCA